MGVGLRETAPDKLHQRRGAEKTDQRGDPMTEYYIPTQASETEFVEKRSRFIGHVWRVDSEGEARARI